VRTEYLVRIGYYDLGFWDKPCTCARLCTGCGLEVISGAEDSRGAM
jgi:hypothetical protein